MDDKKAEIIYTLNRSAAALDYMSLTAEERDLNNPDVKGQCHLLDLIASELKRCAYDLGGD